MKPEKCVQCPLGDTVQEHCDAADPEYTVRSKGEELTVHRPGPECPYVLLDAKDAEIERLRRRLDAGRDYLMQVDEFAADEAFEAFGWTADGLNLMPWADPATLEGGVSCSCDLRTKLAGDGCGVCNPERAKALEVRERT
jgi:hypothetical protein